MKTNGCSCYINYIVQQVKERISAKVPNPSGHSTHNPINRIPKVHYIQPSIFSPTTSYQVQSQAQNPIKNHSSKASFSRFSPKTSQTHSFKSPHHSHNYLISSLWKLIGASLPNFMQRYNKFNKKPNIF